MPWIQQYSCDQCHLVEEQTTGVFRNYVVHWQRDPVPCMQVTAWCTQCDRLRSAESLPDLNKLLALREEFREGTLNSHAGMVEQLSNAKLIATIEPLIRWRLDRRSPPRCLECASFELLFLSPQDNTDLLADFEHPNCGGIFRPTGTEMHFSPKCVYEYDPEGLSLRNT